MARHKKVLTTQMKHKSYLTTGARVKKQEEAEAARDKGGSLAAKAVTHQRKAEKLGPMAGLTREEFDAIRHEEEQINRERLRRLSDEWAQHETMMRRLSYKSNGI